MPGAIVNVAVTVGQRVNAGSTLLSLEAMKMETHVAADRDAEVEAVYVVSGDRVQEKELLVVLRAVGRQILPLDESCPRSFGQLLGR